MKKETDNKPSIKINGDYIKNFLKERDIKEAALSRDLGHSKCYVGNALKYGTMPVTEFKLLCMLTHIDEKAATTFEETGGGVEKKMSDDCLNQNTELIISYIQDLGKIQTEILRTMREEHEILVKMIAEMSETIKDLKVENHKDMQQQLNHMKYGRK